MKRYKWFPLDAETWLSDPKLKLIGATAKGLWIDIICMCHISEKYGFLTINGTKLDQKGLKKILNWSKSDSKKFQILLDYDILKVDPDGFFYCRKLIKDRQLQEEARKNGKKGGNPNLPERVNPPVNQGVKLELEEELELKEELKDKPPTPLPKNPEEEIKRIKKKEKLENDKKKLKQLMAHDYFKNQEFKDLWEQWEDRKGSGFNVNAKKLSLMMLFKHNLDICINGIEKSLSANYQGIALPPVGSGNNKSFQQQEREYEEEQSRLFVEMVDNDEEKEVKIKEVF